MMRLQTPTCFVLALATLLGRALAQPDLELPRVERYLAEREAVPFAAEQPLPLGGFTLWLAEKAVAVLQERDGLDPTRSLAETVPAAVRGLDEAFGVLTWQHLLDEDATPAPRSSRSDPGTRRRWPTGAGLQSSAGIRRKSRWGQIRVAGSIGDHFLQ